MKFLYGWIAVGLVSGLCSTAIVAAPLGTGFTYQGQIKVGGAPLEGVADFQFSLWDEAGSGNPLTGGTQIGVRQPINVLSVTAGLFTVALNAGGEFGGNAFNGSARWLQIAVRSPAGGGGFTTLAPRQPLTAAPHTLFALNAASATNATTATNAANATNANLLDNLDSTAFLQSIPVPLTLNSGEIYTIRGNNSSTDAEATGVYGSATSTNIVTNYGVFGRSDSGQGRGVYGWATTNPGLTYGVYGRSDANAGRGVFGTATFASGNTYGGRFESDSTAGRGVYGGATAATGTTYGVYGSVTSQNGYAGYFIGGRNYFEGNVGIGTGSPERALDVVGRIRLRQGSPPSGGNSAGIDFYQQNPGVDRAFIGMQDDDHVGFYGRGGAGWGLTMDVDNGNVGIGPGNVGIGTSTPAAKLHVNASSDSEPGGGGILVLGATTGANVSFDANEIMARNNGATSTLFVNNGGGDIVFGGAIDIGYERVTDVNPLSAFATAHCPAGKRVLSGGCFCGLDFVQESYSQVDGTGWTCKCSGLFAEATALAICANVK